MTGYIIAGVALGPSGLDLIPSDLLESRLNIFTEIALMLVAFGIGERFDLQQLRASKRSVSRVSAGESLLSFVLVALGVGVAVRFSGGGGGEATVQGCIAAALVCAAIAVATAPAATVSVIRELGASGPLSRLVLSNVVVNNALSVTLFGFCVTLARMLLGTGSGFGFVQAMDPVISTLAALGLGLAVGLLADVIVHRLASRSDVLVVALTAVFLCGGLAQFLGLSPLLAEVAAGFAVVNRDRRDVRAFRALNDFEPPLYGIFFTLAGVELHLAELVQAGAVGLVFILARAAGKYFGAYLGAAAAGMPREHRATIGLGLLPQAGLAIGLGFLVRHDPSLEAIRGTVINVVVASVVVNELIGPPLVRLMLLRGGEVSSEEMSAPLQAPPSELDSLDVVPWTWPVLQPPRHPDGYVAASLSHPLTAPGVMRIATLLGHYYGATPLALHVVTEEADTFWESGPDLETVGLFRMARDEARSLGYEISTEVEFADEPAEGILRATETQNAHAVVLGHPLTGQGAAFGKIVDTVARDAICPIVVVKFSGPLHTERILVPVNGEEDLRVVLPVVCALGMVEEHQITILRLMPRETGDGELRQCEVDTRDWPMLARTPGTLECLAIAAESRVHAVLEQADSHDIIVMAASNVSGLRRVFFGSLAEDVAQRARKPMLLVRAGLENRRWDDVDTTPA